MKKVLDEFKAFAFKGNVLELAVAVILALAFSSVVSSLVQGIILPIIAALFGQPNFDSIQLHLGEAAILIGSFLTALANFLLIAFALFLIIRAVNRLMRPGRDEPPKIRQCPYCLSVLPIAATRCSACTSQLDPLSS